MNNWLFDYTLKHRNQSWRRIAEATNAKFGCRLEAKEAQRIYRQINKRA
jgi:hypothetical protein